MLQTSCLPQHSKETQCPIILLFCLKWQISLSKHGKLLQSVILPVQTCFWMCWSFLGTWCHCSTATVPSPPLSPRWAHGKMESEIRHRQAVPHLQPAMRSGRTRASQWPHTSDTHTDRQTIYFTVLMAHTRSGQNPQQWEERFSSYYISFCWCFPFCQGIPVSARTAAQWLTFLLAELWPSPTKVAGLVSSLLSPSSVLGNSHFASLQLGWGQHLVQSHIVILKQLSPMSF